MGQIRLGQTTSVAPRLLRPPVVATARPMNALGLIRFPDYPDFPSIPTTDPGIPGGTIPTIPPVVPVPIPDVLAPPPAPPAGQQWVFDAAGRIVGSQAAGWLQQEWIAGIPNFWLLIGGGSFLFLLTAVKKRRR